MIRPKNVRRRRAAHAKRLLEWVARKHMLSVKTLQGPERFRHIVAARREFIEMCRERNIGCITIAKVLNRSHCTVLHHLKPATKNQRYLTRKAEAHAHPL